MNPWSTRTVTIAGRRVRFDISPGTGTPILLLHGIPGWRGTWHPAGARLAATHRVIIPDLPGFGESDPPRAPMHAREHAALLLQLLDHLDIAAAHVCGFDFGGPIAVWMIRLAPLRVTTLTLLSANTFTDTPVPAPLRIARVPYLGEAAFRLLMGKTGLTLMWFPAVVQRATFPISRYRRMLDFATGVRTTRQVFVDSLRRLDTLYRPIEDALPMITVPTSVIWGDSDPFFSLAIGRRVAQAIPGATFVPIARCGHFVPCEHPDRVAEAITLVAGNNK